MIEPAQEAFVRDPHRARRRALLRAHPEVRDLLGRDPSTAWWIGGMVLLQIAMAAVVSQLPWWAVILSVYLVGAPAALGLWSLVHECSHDLVLASSRANRRLGIIASLPLALPVGAPFRAYHLLHHRHPADPVLDVDVPSAWEGRWVRGCPLRKALWLAANPLLQSLRTARIRDMYLVDRAFAANLAVQAPFNAAIVLALGWTGLAYLFLSNCFSLGLHPVGARIIQEHCQLAPGQATTSYYGMANRAVFNCGFHAEHHDIARIPWSRLPRLRALAPEFYSPLHAERSWSALLWRFLADKTLRIDGRAR